MNKNDKRKIEDYDHNKIESKWQKIWENKKVFKALDKSKKPKFYGLIEFPYPSGDGLHVGHIRSNTAMDVIARKRRMEGFNVLYPIGWDAFGLPTENYAIKTGVHPIKVTKQNTDTFRRQLKALGFSFDWEREINTTDPNYYKWTQWIFLKLLKNGLAYKKRMPINWCPKDKIGLANEEVVDGCCERCGTLVEKKDKEQWMLAITKYADRLDKDLDDVNFLEKIKIQQRNWIGRSEGVNLKFKVKGLDIHFEMYDSIPQTFMAQTFTIIAPDHPKLYELVKGTPFEKEVLDKAKDIISKRLSGYYEKTGEMEGIFTGRYIEYTPAKRDLPIWVSSYALADYGTGIVNCSYHDERDYIFAKKFNIPLHPVLFPKDENMANRVRNQEIFYREENGILEEPNEFKGRSWGDVREDIIGYIIKNGWGRRATNYKLRDWVFSRQHYWGEPIPVVFCENCKKKKYNVVLLHGFNSKFADSFRPWLKGELEKMGHTVVGLDLPNPSRPLIDEQVDYIIKNVKIDKDTILLGHSLGGDVILRFLEKTKTKIYKAIIVDSPIKPRFNDKERLPLLNAHTWQFDFKKIKKMAESFVILADSEYHTVPKNQLDEMAKNLDAKYITAKPNAPHFKGKEEPEILKIFEDEGVIPIPENKLPVRLPDVEKYQPTDDGESPLSAITKWVEVKCPRCGSSAKRETDTMPNWAGSSWYYLRYIDPKNSKVFADSKKLAYWNMVDWYNGGMEHTTLHLLYSRFWHKFLFDIGLVPNKEPYQKRTSHGLILAEGGVKMSKSKGNVINPDELVKNLGADSLRLYEMFMGPFDQAIAWSTDGIVGTRRFIEKVWRISEKVLAKKNEKGLVENVDLTITINRTVKKVGEDIENMRFNTAVSALMICANEMDTSSFVSKESFEMFVKILSPFAPHLAEELWSLSGHKNLILKENWPVYDSNKTINENVIIVVQINGKIRAQFLAPNDIEEKEALVRAKELAEVQTWTAGKVIKKEIYVKGKLVSIVV